MQDLRNQLYTDTAQSAHWLQASNIELLASEELLDSEELSAG